MGYNHANGKAFILALLCIVREALSVLAEIRAIAELPSVYFGLCIFPFSF